MSGAPVRCRRALAVLLVASLAGGCMGGSMQPTHYYTLRPPAAADSTSSAPGDGWRVGVDSIAVDPPYDQDRIVYRSGSDSAEIGFYHYHRWAAPLGRLLQVALVDGLGRVEGIGVIEPVRSGTDYDGRLGGRLIVLEEVDSPAGAEVRMILELSLRDAGGESVWSGTLSTTADERVASVAGVAELAQRAVDQAMRQAAAQLRPALAARLAGEGVPPGD